MWSLGVGFLGSEAGINHLVMGNTPHAMALRRVMQPVSGKLVGYNRNPGLMRGGCRGVRGGWDEGVR